MTTLTQQAWNYTSFSPEMTIRRRNRPVAVISLWDLKTVHPASDAPLSLLWCKLKFLFSSQLFPEAQFAGYSSPTDKTVPPALYPSFLPVFSYISLCFLPEFLFWRNRLTQLFLFSLFLGYKRILRPYKTELIPPALFWQDSLAFW